MSMNHGYNTMGGIEGGSRQKRREKISHQLGKLMSYGDPHQLILMQVRRDCHATNALELEVYESSKRKLSGCASNLLAHEDLGHLRKPIVGIYKPSSIMKNSH